jgi:gluconokinase
MIIILMGVSGCGKTTVGIELARALGWEFHDADELHPAANFAKMRRGIALDDEDRRPWLDAVRALIERCLGESRGAVVACSALKRAYRDEIAVDRARVKFVYLHGSRELIAGRIAHRRGHFMPSALLDSQFAALETPADALTVEITAAPVEIAAAIRARLGL